MPVSRQSFLRRGVARANQEGVRVPLGQQVHGAAAQFGRVGTDDHSPERTPLRTLSLA
jgi:hypothetical protein